MSGRDDQWFEALFTRFHGPVRAYASRRAPDDADDIVADVFAVACWYIPIPPSRLLDGWTLKRR